jgi:hypothetical protein
MSSPYSLQVSIRPCDNAVTLNLRYNVSHRRRCRSAVLMIRMAPGHYRVVEQPKRRGMNEAYIYNEFSFDRKVAPISFRTRSQAISKECNKSFTNQSNLIFWDGSRSITSSLKQSPIRGGTGRATPFCAQTKTVRSCLRPAEFEITQAIIYLADPFCLGISQYQLESSTNEAVHNPSSRIS